jgi:hypothetical protein
MIRSGFMGSMLRVEALEPRCMLDGNVSAQVLAGDLVISGDNQDNLIEITPTGQSGAYMVEGLGDTTVNDQSDPVLVSGVRDDFRIYMGAGDDTVVLQGHQPPIGAMGASEAPFLILSVPGDLWIRTFAGNDTVLINGVNVGHSAHVKTYDGDDRVLVGGTHLDHVIVGAEAQRSETCDFMTANVYIAKDLRIITHGGRDVVGVAEGGFYEGVIVQIGRNLIINSSTGDDRIGVGVVIARPLPCGLDGGAAPVDYGPIVHVGWDMVVGASTGDNLVEIAVVSSLDGVLPILPELSSEEDLENSDSENGCPDMFGEPRVSVHKSLVVTTLTGRDYVGLGVGQILVPMPMTDRAENGNDNGTDPMASRLYVKKYVTVVTSSGEDQVGINDAWFGRNLVVNTGLGNDHLGIDNTTAARNAYLYTSLGNDNVWISRMDVARGFRLYTGAGSDNVSLGDYFRMDDDGPYFGVRAKYAKVFTSSGEDYVNLVDSYFDDLLRVDLGPDDDELWAIANRAARAYLYGRHGDDGITEDVDDFNDFDMLKVRWFEDENARRFG